MSYEYGIDYIDITEMGADCKEYIKQKTMRWVDPLPQSQNVTKSVTNIDASKKHVDAIDERRSA
jgi:hypothetical protein